MLATPSSGCSQLLLAFYDISTGDAGCGKGRESMSAIQGSCAAAVMHQRRQMDGSWRVSAVATRYCLSC